MGRKEGNAQRIEIENRNQIAIANKPSGHNQHEVTSLSSCECALPTTAVQYGDLCENEPMAMQMALSLRLYANP